MAAALPVLLACFLALIIICHLPASAPATTLSNPIAAKANGTSPSVVQQQKAAPAAAAQSSSSTGEDEAGKKKELEEIEKLKQEAKAKGLVSPTNCTGSYKGMSREFVDGHNEVRQRYGVPKMTWSKKLARNAQRWSNAMRKDCQLKHSTGNYGESVFASHKDSGWNATARDALRSWISEEPIYDRLTGNCTAGRHFNECGHFSIMVDKNNTKIGCGRGECYSGGVFITCNYYISGVDP